MSRKDLIANYKVLLDGCKAMEREFCKAYDITMQLTGVMQQHKKDIARLEEEKEATDKIIRGFAEQVELLKAKNRNQKFVIEQLSPK
jgi:hypothetical protein